MAPAPTSDKDLRRIAASVEALTATLRLLIDKVELALTRIPERKGGGDE
jgi:hypothetical protein